MCVAELLPEGGAVASHEHVVVRSSCRLQSNVVCAAVLGAQHVVVFQLLLSSSRHPSLRSDADCRVTLHSLLYVYKLVTPFEGTTGFQ